MPWYKPKNIARYKYTSNEQAARGFVYQPFKYNNVIYDYDTFPDNYLTNILIDSDLSINLLYTSLSSTFTQNRYPIATLSSNNNWSRMGFPFTIYKKSEINVSYLIKLESRNLHGKYKIKNITNPFDNELLCGSTFKIHFQINGKNFKYLTTSNNKTFSGGFERYYIGNYYIGGYNEVPALGNSLNPPSDIEYYSVVSGSDVVIDFGQNNQEIPSNFYDWFIKNFDKVYENIYTIKSVTGSTIATLTEAPPMTSATLSVVGNAKYLTLKGENDTNYTMEWTSETPQGKIFAGLATSKGGSIVIPVGETSTINLTESTDLYEVWQTYRPPTTTFEIKTYNYSGETSRVDKTDYLTPISTISGVLRGEASLLNFNVLIQSDTVPNFNYCYIDKFKRYYYVTEPVSVRQNLWEMTMQVDALMTYKDSLLKCEGYIDRNEYIQNKMIIDNNRAIMQGADFEEDTITNAVFGEGSFVLSGLGITTRDDIGG